MRVLSIAIAALLSSSLLGHAATFQGLGFLALDDSASHPRGVSADGGVVVGEALGMNHRPFVWTPALGMRALPLPPEWDVSWSEARAVTADGAVIVGVASVAIEEGVLRLLPLVWRRTGDAYEIGTPQPLIDLALGDPGIHHYVRLVDVSSDGQILIGNAIHPTFGPSPFRWEADSQFEYFSSGSVVGASADGAVIAVFDGVNFGDITRIAESNTPIGVGAPYDISDDGDTIAGWIFHEGHEVAFRWTLAGGAEPLGTLGDHTESQATAVSADGAIVAGSSGPSLVANRRAFLWDAANGMRALQGELESQLGAPLDGWTLLEAHDLSPDGTIVVGTGRNPEGASEAFLARLPDPDAARSGLVALAALAWRSRAARSLLTVSRGRRPRRTGAAA
jgi:uncharacterized membrane protein